MAACRSCGAANAATARFCHACGRPLWEPAATAGEVRKTVTVLFADVAGSTALGERLDPEALRRVMSRYFDEMRTVLEHHGGTVEKFIGDAVMAVFGVPTAHEDDALRAVRAADEMRERLETLNADLARDYGVELEVRIGVNTGEVIAGDRGAGQALVTGDAVNVAKRLEQAAPPGGILIGKATYPLVRDAVEAGPLESFPVKGKSEPVSPLRLDAVDRAAAGIARRFDRPLVGRQEELAALQIAFTRAEAERACRLFTILGAAGIGKSRLVAELVTALGDQARVLSGRCLPYGEGVTFWPLREIVRDLGDTAGVRSALAGTDDAELVAERVLAAVGASADPVQADETTWAFRKMFEALARERPLVLVLEDLHCADRPLLDLIEYLLGWTRGAAVLLICTARPELIEERPAWLRPSENADALVLEPLTADESRALLENVGSGVRVEDDIRARITRAAEGNPLFVEQMVALLTEDGDQAESIPPSIQALLDERLDRLSAPERAVLERAAVIGREFARAPLTALVDPELRGGLGGSLMALVRRQLIRPDVTAAGRDDAFRFEHVLIRDAAYERAPKELRAELHERLADWLEAGGDGARTEEIVGYHLEQAHRNRRALGAGDERTRTLGLRAAERLASAGRRAFTRGDMGAAVGLLGRAGDLLGDDSPAWLEVARDLGVSLIETGEIERAERVLSRAVDRAEAAGDTRTATLALLERSLVRLMAHPSRRADEAREAAERAVSVFGDLGDDQGLARAWHLIGRVEWINGRAAAMEEALERGLEHARRAGAADDATILKGLALAALFGPRPIGDAIRRCEDLRAAGSRDRTVAAVAGIALAGLEARRGRFDDARRLQEESRETFSDLGLSVSLAGTGMYAGAVELLAGDAVAAEREFRSAYEELEALGEQGLLRSTTAALLGTALCALGREDEAERYTVVSEQTTSPDDLVSHVIWRHTRARILARGGASEEGEQLARAAVALAGRTDFLWLHGDALVALATVVGAAAKTDEARAALEEALRLYEAKGDAVSAAKARDQLAELPGALDRETRTR